jgi:predicted NBD/HSP70 family sugar kinase
VILLTFGTGIGSALFANGTLFPNTELGHLVSVHWMSVFEMTSSDHTLANSRQGCREALQREGARNERDEMGRVG